jgi:PAS domain S-box-containing protein
MTPPGVSVTQPATEASARTPIRRRGGLHSTGLIVAVVGLLLSATAFFVTYRDTEEREDNRLQDVADGVADQVGEVLADVDALVSGVEGVLIATAGPNEPQLERYMSLQVSRSDLITSATLLTAREGSDLNRFAQVGQSRYFDFDAQIDEELVDRIATLDDIPEGAVRLITREPLVGGPSAAVGAAFTTLAAEPEEGEEEPTPVSWVVEVELTFPSDAIAALTQPYAGDPAVAVFVGDDPAPENMLLGPSSGQFMAAAQRNIQLGGDNVIVAITPRSDLLDRNEELIPLLVFLGGLTFTTILTPLVARLASRREEVRALSAQRDELDRALNVSRQIERELRASEQRFRSVLQSSPDVVLWIDGGTVQILNRDDLFGSPPEAVATIDDLLEVAHVEDLEDMREGFDRLQALEWGDIAEFEGRISRPDGTWEWVRIRAGRVQRDDDGRGPILAVLTTITDQKREEARRAQLEAQLVQSQRLEAVGQLAGGVAHDFNNILAAIVSGAELVLDEVDGEAKDDVEEIRRTARRGSDLARQLLLFSRRDRGSSPEVVDVNEVIADVETMLRRTLDESIELTTDLTPDPHKVHIDPSQIERILMNLTINARDAMPEGGSITIATANVDADEEFTATRPGLVSGPYLELTVTDTGAGMPEDVKRHAFEPFFSTKEVGKGTGLGLATVYGIVQGAQGHIEIDSETGAGTTFTLLFPRTRLGQEATASHEPGGQAIGGTERILLVEDEPAVREAARRLLEKRGYRVSVAPDGKTAVMLAESGSFDLLLTDVLMPGGMNGRQVALEVLKAQPDIAVLYMTGHSDDVLDDVGIDEDEREALIVRKPFTEDELLRAINLAVAPIPEPTT